MNKNIIRPAVASLVMASMLFVGTFAPAKADNNSTMNDILIGAAALAGLATVYNVEHKAQLAGTIQGYLPDGSVVYEDGRVVSPNGSTWYPGNSGEQVACSNQQCMISGQNGGYYGYNNGYNNGYGANTGYARDQRNSPNYSRGSVGYGANTGYARDQRNSPNYSRGSVGYGANTGYARDQRTTQPANVGRGDRKRGH